MTYRKVNKREDSFLELISASKVDIASLRELSSSGIVETCGIRAICWRLFLFCLPNRRADWVDQLTRQRNDYRGFLHEIIIDPSIKRSSSEKCSEEDHPLNPNPQSGWNSYFKDNEVLLQIDKDVRRLCPDISFFQNATPYPCEEMVSPDSKVETLRKRVERGVLTAHNMTRQRLGISNLLNSRKQSSQEYETLQGAGQEAHWEVVERILFVYAKLNPGTSYVQGMNEIVGPLYYTLMSDPNPEWKEHAEADTFFCFTNLMAEIRDNFIKSLDYSRTGIEASMERVVSHLKIVDHQVYTRLDEQNIKPAFFLFRWITLLLSQEFPLPDVIYLWDILFSDKTRFDLLYSMCTAMIVLVRDRLLSGDFSHNVKLLQNYPEEVGTQAIAEKSYHLLPSLPTLRH